MTQHRLAVDIGGTFTDVVLETPGGRHLSSKTPTTPLDPVVGAMDGIQKIMRQAATDLEQVSMVVHGTTLATNTLIEKKGARVGALLSAGFRDTLEIGYERRYNQEDLFLVKPDLLVPRERCLTVSERTGPNGAILSPLDPATVLEALKQFERLGVDSIAVCLLHAYANPEHEIRIAEHIAQHRPDLAVSLSSGVSPEVREFDRLCTTIANAYIKPAMADYLARFDQSLRERGFRGRFFMMTSSGGMTTLDNAKRHPVRLVESGPSGGAILAARVARRCALDRVVSFDMGGTTAKFCLIDDGKPLTSRQFEAARAERFMKGSGMPLRIPAIEMIEIGAGGGSVATVNALGQIAIGPESMGSSPGPACFGRGGEQATVTDADVVLGNIDASSFAEGELRIDEAAAQTAVSRALCRHLDLDPLAAANGISQMVGENMANAGRVHAAERGAGLAERTLIAFGGNGPLHATRVAEKMGVSRIIVPADPGVGSAMGFLYAPVSYEIVSSFHTTLERFDFAGVNRQLDRMTEEAQRVVNPGDESVTQTRTAYMRYAGQGHEIEVELPTRALGPDDLPALTRAYDHAYRHQFKRTVPGMQIEIMNWAVRIECGVEPDPAVEAATISARPSPSDTRPIHFGGQQGRPETPLYERNRLRPGDAIDGPALIVEGQTSTLVEPGFGMRVDGDRNLVLTREAKVGRSTDAPIRDGTIDRQLMWNRLLAVVEEQAQALIRSAFSPIVRECGDISAGIFDQHGRMLAQAVTGTPGHINTMASGVEKFIAALSTSSMKPGDIYVTNDPWLAAGHLNDFMLVQPVFRAGQLVGFTSCTSHLIDVGGKCMGPDGSDVFDEGLRIPVCRLVDQGVVNGLLLDIVRANSRQPTENEGDLYALIACCEVGARRLTAMMDEYELTTLEPLAEHVIESARRATLAALAELPRGRFEHAITLDGYDFEIELKAAMTIDRDRISLDFSGSSSCSKFGINVPLNYAAAYSVFAIRCAVAPGIPNNAGALAPFRVSAPEGCILNAIDPAPVAMRHTIGQLLPDLVFGCLHQALPGSVPAEGASCMYDLPMRHVPATRQTRFAVELVHNGGTGARPTQDGLSATAFPSGVWGSQVEVTECTAPLRVLRRELRTDSGGAGRYRGGLGQTIEIESAEGADFQLFLSLDRTRHPPRGRAQGHCGATGGATLASGAKLPGRGEQIVGRGDRLIFQTPGGGGYGDPRRRDAEAVRRDVIGGLVSAAAARETYGVVLDRSNALDLAATLKLRGARPC